MGKVVEEIGIGAALVGTAVAAEVFSLGLATPLVAALASTGVGMVISGVGTLLSQKATGISTTSRNPIMPWQIVYGRKKVGGTIVYQEEVADNNRILLLVIAVAAHPCQEIESVWLNNKAINLQLNTQFADDSNPNGFWQSFDPPQGTWQIETISRVNDVVSVTFAQNPSSLFTNFNGQTLRIENSRDSAGGNSFDGYFPVVQTGNNSFTFTSGGPQGAGTGTPGHVVSTWPQYGGNVTVGYYLGDQTSASGIILGNTAGYWTSAHILKGITYVAMKLTWDDRYFTGLPEISFVVQGRKDIYDPRSGKTGYTTNAALCIADYLAQPIWGYNVFGLDSTVPAPEWTPATWGPQIPVADLISAANICDTLVPLANGGSEPMYACDGAFDVSVDRGEVVANLLTSCAGRLVEIGGTFFIMPGVWVTPSGAIEIGTGDTGPKMMMNSLGLVAEFYNNPVNNYIPNSAGSTESQFVYALGLLAAFQATGNTNAQALATLIISAIEPYLFRGQPIPDRVTASAIWSPNSYFDVKQPFLAFDGSTVSVNTPFASTIEGGWRPLVGAEIQTSCDAYNWAIRLFQLAAKVIEGTTPATQTNLGFGNNPFDTYPFGDPEQPNRIENSSYLAMLAAIEQMAAIAYQLSFSTIDGSTLTVINPLYQGGMIPFIVDFTGSPAPKLNTWMGPAYAGFQSPWAVSQVNPAGVAAAVQFLAEAQATLAAGGTVADTLTVTITGANPQTLTIAIEINSVGQATATFSYAGLNAGTDTITPTLPSHSLTGNAGQVAWSAYQVTFGVFGVQIAVMAADGTGLFNGATAALSTQAVQGLMFNSHPSSIFPGDPHDSGNQANPFVSNIVDSSGGYQGDQAINNTSGQFNAVITGSFTVENAGTLNFAAYVNSAFVIGVQGATYVSGAQNFGNLFAGTAVKGYPALAGLNTAGDWPGGNWAVVNFALHFATPGIYNFEIDYASGEFSERQFCLLYGELSAVDVIPNIGLAGVGGATATGTAPSGDVQLTPYSGGYAIGATAFFTVQLSGLSYSGPSAGPFAPVYQFPVPPGAQTWLPVNTFGWAGPDPNWISGYYQYRPLAELCDLIAAAAGTESWYSQAVSVTTSFLAWIDGKWTTASTGPPNWFPQSGGTTTGQDVQCAALVLYSVLSLDLAARPTGTGGPSAMNGTQHALLTLVYTFFGDTYLTSGPMAGTFCLDPSGAQTWSAIWAGEILRALSMLVQWATVNAQAETKAQAIVWIDGLINFGLNAVVAVDPDLGYTVDDLRAGPHWKPKLARTELFNGIKGTYISEANQWQQSDFPSYAQDAIHGYTNGTAAHNNDANWDADGQRLWKDVQLPFTSSVSMAQRLAKIELLRGRWQGRGTLPGLMPMYKSAPLDTVYFSYANFGWVNKVLEIANCRLMPLQLEGDVPGLGVELDVAESDASVYEWDVTEELNSQGYSYLPGLQNLSPD